MSNKISQIIKENNLPLQINFSKASEISSIPIWTLRKYEHEGKMPRARRIGTRCYINTQKFLHWLEYGETSDK